MARTISIAADKRSKQLAYYHRSKSPTTKKPPVNPYPRTSFKHRLFNQIKCKRCAAKKRGWAFDLDKEWLAAQPDHCVLSGMAFTVCAKGPLTASFDKIDPKAGYTKTNTRLVCLWVNTAKMQWPDEDIKKYIVLAAEHIKSIQSGKSPV